MRFVFSSATFALSFLLSGWQIQQVAATLNKRADPVIDAEDLVPPDQFESRWIKVGCYYYPCKSVVVVVVVVCC